MKTRVPALVVLVAAFLAGGYPSSVASYLAAATWLTLALLATWWPPPVPSRAVLALIALAALTLLSALWGRTGEVLHVVPLPVLYAGLLYATEWAGPRSADALRPVIVILAAAGIIGRATGLAAPSLEPGSSRMAWPIGYANGLGLLCAIGVILCASSRRWWPGAAVCGIALVWTLSRSAIVAGAAGLSLLAPRRLQLAAAMVLAIVAVLVARPVYQHFQSPARDTRGVTRLATVSGHGRTHLWRAALHEGEQHPVAGGGAGSWRREATGRHLPANAHSLELETFAELGVLGLAALGAFFIAVPRRGALFAAFAAWLLVSAIDWDWQLPAVTGAAVICAGSLTGTRRRLASGVAVSAVALAIGVAVLADTVLGYA
ncbi:MAG TPA: O-antigen ligase family protein [Gaiellaceae bacterium]|nr:O-antigen ligase family protein [Gaiellaceae bacterium]